MEQPDLDLDVHWRPFELNDDTPEEGLPLAEYFGVPKEDVASRQEGVRSRAAELGMPFRSPDIICNTRKAHILSEYAREKGRLEPLHRALFQAYFAEGLNLADGEVLREMAQRAGLDPEEALAALGAPRYLAAVDAALQHARDLGITGVPTFIVEGKYKMVGALPFEALRDALRQIAVAAD